MAAISGVIILALPITIIGANFDEEYDKTQRWELFKKQSRVFRYRSLWLHGAASASSGAARATLGHHGGVSSGGSSMRDPWGIMSNVDNSEESSHRNLHRDAWGATSGATSRTAAKEPSPWGQGSQPSLASQPSLVSKRSSQLSVSPSLESGQACGQACGQASGEASGEASLRLAPSHCSVLRASAVRMGSGRMSGAFHRLVSAAQAAKSSKVISRPIVPTCPTPFFLCITRFISQFASQGGEPGGHAPWGCHV